MQMMNDRILALLSVLLLASTHAYREEGFDNLVQIDCMPCRAWDAKPERPPISGWNKRNEVESRYLPEHVPRRGENPNSDLLPMTYNGEPVTHVPYCTNDESVSGGGCFLPKTWLLRGTNKNRTETFQRELQALCDAAGVSKEEFMKDPKKARKKMRN